MRSPANPIYARAWFLQMGISTCGNPSVKTGLAGGGVRPSSGPSSGAATSKYTNACDFTDEPGFFDTAAPEDGRTPKLRRAPGFFKWEFRQAQHLVVRSHRFDLISYSSAEGARPLADVSGRW